MIEEDKIRPFLKWPGGKFRLIDRIRLTLPKGNKLIEPFVGSGAIFLNTNYQYYLLNDANQDLITLYQTLQQEGLGFIEFCQDFFVKKNNTEKKYYQLRSKFNASKDPILKSALFLYLNRHGYNGLCRYNTKKGEFNVPFGRYSRPYFPLKEMFLFYQKAKNVTFLCENFTETLVRATEGCVVYCDPPYVPLTNTAKFTSYRSGGFSLEEQKQLGLLSRELAAKGIPVLLSNHSNEFTAKLYKNASVIEFPVRRFISCLGSKRGTVLEMLALYNA